MHHNGHGLAFLLSIGGLPIACRPERVMTTGGETDAATGTGGEDTSATDVVTSGFLSADDGAPEETGVPGPPVNDACVAYYKTMLKCFPDEGVAYAAYWAAFCDLRMDLGLQHDGPACAAAVAAAYVCMSGLACNILVHDDAPHCVAEAEAADATCPTPVD